jgi:hypothetical protein
VLAAIHGLLRAERERLCRWICYLSFDCKGHTLLPSRLVTPNQTHFV